MKKTFVEKSQIACNLNILHYNTNSCYRIIIFMQTFLFKKSTRPRFALQYPQTFDNTFYLSKPKNFLDCFFNKTKLFRVNILYKITNIPTVWVIIRFRKGLIKIIIPKNTYNTIEIKIILLLISCAFLKQRK